MGDLSERDVEDLLEGVQPPGRDDLAPVVELTTWLHASREFEPPPAMRDDLSCQIEGGLRGYQRSSRRPPAHLRHDRAGTRRLVRESLAGPGRPIASVAAAAVLLVGVILAVRSGDPAREPSAFVSPSAQGLPAAGDGTTSSSTTAAPTTTSRPETGSAPAGPASTVTTVPNSEPSTATDATTPESPRAPDTTSAGPRAREDGDTPPPTGEQRGDADHDVDGSGSEDDSGDGRAQGPPGSDPADETSPSNLPASGWGFDPSEWFPADLWAAVNEAEEMGEAADPGDDAPTGDHDPSGDRREADVSGRDHTTDGGSDRLDAGDPDQEDSQAD
ncbi:MAG: hypothetical protein ACRD07_11115 [Acidimicrobiales bacterium]